MLSAICRRCGAVDSRGGRVSPTTSADIVDRLLGTTAIRGATLIGDGPVTAPAVRLLSDVYGPAGTVAIGAAPLAGPGDAVGDTPATADAAPPELPPSYWDEVGPSKPNASALKAALADTVLVDAAWLARLADAGDILPRCQDLPEGARVTLEEMEQWMDYSTLGVLVISYPWWAPPHSTPSIAPPIAPPV